MQKVFKRISNSKNRLARVLAVAGVYILFWCVFYGSQIILPKSWAIYIGQKTGIFMPIYIFAIVPLISFFIPVYVVRHMKTKPWVTYLMHVILIIVSIAVFFALSLLRAYTATGPEDFIK
ncbi:MAG: hypothetical protein KBC12_02945 [Candidatus Pacebacteria bacterium]|nr:hypothetical protein [Candidatus Paceibacterota bacterium]MBP9851576.1 hypothetical protein [Candidatus Paceibacterota bacterium]